MPAQPEVVVFDVIETLFPLEPIRAKLEAANLPGHALETWFAQLLRNAFALSATGSYQPFRELAVDALKTVANASGVSLTEDQIVGIIKTFAELDAYPDVAPSMGDLAKRGIRVVTLTNGSEEVTRKLLDRAGVSEFVEQVISVDEVRLWKPRKEVYAHCAQRCGVERSSMMLIATHGWDIHGASQAGMRTGFVRRKSRAFPEVMAKPELEGGDLTDLIVRLLARDSV
ncbi:haloacid dehalogenase type II [Stutzerimonas stutzeri]|jgi:2-haloacid dehalogenase|uniref:(S)-2-haloacid dehalogenase n=1 Tax=Stutzerimonas stutzeri TaxID=316 RepID=A0A172WK47_STUST|nr:haloacid dehalogenase type II [Stutzerimonas stutzeri]ANF23821.1 haloacid dehalogenase, type II [Stutzerimonas stutzeri]